MANSRVLEYILKLRDEASGTAQKAARNIDGAMRNAEKASRLVAGGLLAAGTAAAGFVGYGAKIAGDMEAAEQGFKALLGSGEEARATMERIKAEAKATPFELPGLVKGTQALAAITKDGNIAIDTLMDVGKAVAVSGKGAEELDRVILNLQQIASTGKVTAMDIRQFQGAIPIFNDIVEASGMTVDELQNSRTAAQDLFKAFKLAGQEGGIAAEGFTGQAGTFNQLTGNMKDNIQILAMDIAKTSGAFDAMKKAIEEFNRVLENIPVETVIAKIKEYFPIIAGTIAGALTPALYGLVMALPGAIAGLWALVAPLLPFIAIGAAVGLAIKFIVDKLGGWEQAQKKVSEVLEAGKQIVETAKEKFDQFVEFLSGLPQKVGQFFTRVKEKIVELTIQALTWYINFWSTLPEKLAYILGFVLGKIVKWGIDTWNYLKENVPIWIEGVVNFFSELPGKIWTWLVNTYQKIVDWGVKSWNYLKENIPKWLQSVVDWFKAMPGRIWEGLSELVSKIMDRFNSAWQAIKDEVSSWPGKIWEWGKNVAESFVDGIKNGLKGLKNAFVNGFNNAKGAVESNSPPKEGPFKNIDKWGYNIGESFISNMREAVNDLGLSSMPALATAGQTTTNNNSQYTTQAPITINAQINNDMDAQQLAGIIGMELELRSRF